MTQQFIFPCVSFSCQKLSHLRYISVGESHLLLTDHFLEYSAFTILRHSSLVRCTSHCYQHIKCRGFTLYENDLQQRICLLLSNVQLDEASFRTGSKIFIMKEDTYIIN